VILLVKFQKPVLEALRSLLNKDSGGIELPMVKANWAALAAQTEAAIQDAHGGRDLPNAPPDNPPGEVRQITDSEMVGVAQQFIAIHRSLQQELLARGIDVSAYGTLEALSAVAVVEGVIGPEDHQTLVKMSELTQALMQLPEEGRKAETARMLSLAAGVALAITGQVENARETRLAASQGNSDGLGFSERE